jgi:hypothetical protein
VAEYLADAGHTVSVVNPARIKAYGATCQVRTPVLLSFYR